MASYADIKNGMDTSIAEDYVESRYPETARRFKELAGDGLFYGFFCVKQMDYGPENIRGGNDMSTELGRAMSVREVGRRMGDKVARIGNLTYKAIEVEPLKELHKRLMSLADHDLMRVAIGEVADAIHARRPANESLEDSLVDLAIYGVIATIVYEGLWGK